MRQRTEKRKVYTAEEKLSIVREHLIGKKPVSELCEGYGIVPSQFYKWQQRLFENGAQCLENRNGVTCQRESCAVPYRFNFVRLETS
jgi:transposase-like protein